MNKHFELLEQDGMVRISRVPSLRPPDDRAPLFALSALMPERRHTVSVGFDKAGEVRGNHYHLGSIPANFPSVMFITHGEFLVEWAMVEHLSGAAPKSKAGRVVGPIKPMLLKRGDLVVIEPAVFHRVTCLSLGGGVLTELVMDPEDVNGDDVYYLLP